MDIWKSLDGMGEAELTSAEPGAALEAANARGIPLYDVIQASDLTARFRVRRRDYRALEALSEKRGETLRLRRRLGAYWTLKRLLARPMLMGALAVFLAGYCALTGFSAATRRGVCPSSFGSSTLAPESSKS